MTKSSASGLRDRRELHQEPGRASERHVRTGGWPHEVVAQFRQATTPYDVQHPRLDVRLQRSARDALAAPLGADLLHQPSLRLRRQAQLAGSQPR